MRNAINPYPGIRLAASFLPGQASVRAIFGHEKAMLATIRNACADAVLDLREMSLDDAQTLTSNSIRLAQSNDCERLELRGEHSQGANLPPAERQPWRSGYTSEAAT